MPKPKYTLEWALKHVETRRQYRRRSGVYLQSDAAMFLLADEIERLNEIVKALASDDLTSEINDEQPQGRV